MHTPSNMSAELTAENFTSFSHSELYIPSLLGT